MLDFTAHFAYGWWVLIGFGIAATTSLGCHAVEVRSGKELPAKVVGAVILLLGFAPVVAGFVFCVASDTIRTDRLNDAVAQAIEDKYDVQVGHRREDYRSEEPSTALTWVIDDEATNCLLQEDHHWATGHPVIAEVYAVCDGRELPLVN